MAGYYQIKLYRGVGVDEQRGIYLYTKNTKIVKYIGTNQTTKLCKLCIEF